MDIRITSAIVGAIVGGVITYAVGPILNNAVEKRLHDSTWEGTWQSLTCRQGQPERRWQIVFEQNGNRVSGYYKGIMDRNKGVVGTITGNVSVTQLEGTWEQLQGDQLVSGELDLLLNNELQTFTGTYSNSRENNVGRWVGNRNELDTDCDQLS